MTRYTAHRFAAAADFLLLAEAVPEGTAIDTIGDIAGLDGWHVNVAWPGETPEAWAASQIEAAEAPRWWAGVPRVPPAPPPAPVPAEVTNYQARAVMRATILGDGRSMETTVREALTAAREAAAVLPEAAADRIAADQAWLAWEQSNVFLRHSPLVTAIAAQLGLDAAAVDDLFRAAAAIAA